MCRQLTQPGTSGGPSHNWAWNCGAVPVCLLLSVLFCLCFCCDCDRYCWPFCSIVVSSCMLVPPGKGSAAVDCVYNVLIKESCTCCVG